MFELLSYSEVLFIWGTSSRDELGGGLPVGFKAIGTASCSMLSCIAHFIIVITFKNDSAQDQSYHTYACVPVLQQYFKSITDPIN